MLKPNTTFVLGAGVSFEFGMPLGGTLKGRIASVLPDNNGNGDDTVRAFTFHNTNVQIAGEACMTMRRALNATASIDNLVEHFRDDPEVVRIAKLGIAAAIFNAEAKCQLSKAAEAKSLSATDFDDTSLGQIFRLIVGRVAKADLKAAFERVAFVNFNYDRCLEQFLIHALRTHSGLSENEAAKIVASVRIYRPYGGLGPLPYMTSADGVPFGQSLSGINLSKLAEAIQTFSEERRSEEHSNIDELVGGADRLILLGCHPHPQNLALLKPDTFSASEVFMTAHLAPPADPNQNLSATGMDAFARPTMTALMNVFGNWHSPPSTVQIEASTSLQMVSKYGFVWTAT